MVKRPAVQFNTLKEQRWRQTHIYLALKELVMDLNTFPISTFWTLNVSSSSAKHGTWDFPLGRTLRASPSTLESSLDGIPLLFFCLWLWHLLITYVVKVEFLKWPAVGGNVEWYFRKEQCDICNHFRFSLGSHSNFSKALKFSCFLPSAWCAPPIKFTCTNNLRFLQKKINEMQIIMRNLSDTSIKWNIIQQ